MPQQTGLAVGCGDGKTPWDGVRLTLDFEPAQTKLIVLDRERHGETYRPLPPETEKARLVNGIWTVRAIHRDASVKELEMDSLQDFNTLPFPWFRHFAGQICYTTKVSVEDPAAYAVLDAGTTYWGITELFVNGESAGVKWYGDRKFDIAGRLHKGNNVLTVKVTTLLGNYTKSLKSNKTAQRHAGVEGYRSLGLGGPVKIY